MKIEIHYIFSLIAFFQAILLSIYFISKKRIRQNEGKLFSLILFLFAILIMTNFMNSVGAGEYFIHYHKSIFLIRQLSLILIPLLFIYFRKLNNLKNYKKGEYLYHFIPFILIQIYFIIELDSVKYFIIGNSRLNYISATVIFLQSLLYLILTGIIIKRKSNDDKNEKDKLSIKSLTRIFIILFGFLWFIQFNSFILIDIQKKYSLCPYTSSLYFIIVFIIINIVLFLAIDNPKNFSKSLKYKYSKLSVEDIDSIYNKVVQLLHEELLYRNPELTLARLSERMSIPEKYISQAINEKSHRSFSAFINKYRIEESKALLDNITSKELTISEVYYSVGFNSKSSFNICFKKTYGITPTEYIIKKNGRDTSIKTSFSE